MIWLAEGLQEIERLTLGTTKLVIDPGMVTMSQGALGRKTLILKENLKKNSFEG